MIQHTADLEWSCPAAHSRLPILLIDDEGRIHDANPAWADWQGSRAGEDGIASHLTDPDVLTFILEEVRTTGFWEGEIFVRRAEEGARRPCLARIDRAYTVDQEGGRFVCVLHDISARKLAEASVRSLAGLSAALPLALAQLTPQGGIAYRNKAYMDLHRHLDEPPLSHTRARRFFHVARQRQKSKVFKARYRNGSVILWRYWSGQQGERCFVLGEEVTKSERLIEDQDAQMRLLAESAASLPMLFYRSEMEDGHLTRLQWLGSHSATLLGLDGDATASFDAYKNHVHPVDLERCLTSLSRAGERNQLWRETYRYRHPRTGQWRLHQTEAICIKQFRSVVQWSGWIRDITEESEIRSQLDRVERMETLRTLSGGLAHEFNNILAIIAGWTEICQTRDPAPTVAEGLTKIASQIGRGRDLVRRMSGLIRPDTEGACVSNAGDILAEVYDLAQALLPSAIELRLRLDPKPRHVFAEAQKLQQALLNLIGNARDALPDGGDIFLSLFSRESKEQELSQAAEEVVFEVRDTGQGVPEAIREKIFDLLFTTKNDKGSGIGLSMVHRIAAEFNGRVECLPQAPGDGAVFQMVFPSADTVHEAPSRSVGEALAPSKTSFADPPPSRVGCLTVLLIEDNLELCNLQKCAFQVNGWRVLDAPSVGAARRLFESQHHQLNAILCDWDLPGGSTLDLVRYFRERAPSLPIIMVTGLLTTTRLEKLASMGIHHVLSKPVAPSRIIEVVEAVATSCEA